MDKLRCIVVDDEPLAVQMIENYIARTPFLELAGSYNDPVLALDAIRSQEPELAFLDIQMPDLSGLELSRMLPEGTSVVFTTAFRDYALEGFEVGAMDYLLKPIRYQKFLEAAQKVLRLCELRKAASSRAPVAERPDSVFIKSEGSLVRVELSDILYISGMKDYVCVHLESRKTPLVTHLTMKATMDMLPADAFMRVHRSSIVALDKIETVSADMDIIIGGKPIHVGEQFESEFRKWLAKRQP